MSELLVDFPSRKRTRTGHVAQFPDATHELSLRDEIAMRVSPDACPAFWCDAASAAGVSGADKLLCHIGASITDALRSTSEAAEVARAGLQRLRMTLHAAVDERIEFLERNVNNAEASKIAALEQELIRADSLLERWRTESLEIKKAASTLGDADFALQHAALTSRLDSMATMLRALPTAVVEPPFIKLSADTSVLLRSIMCFGHVAAPRAITASDLILEGNPTFARPGSELHLELTLRASHAAQCSEELELSLCQALGTTQVYASVESAAGDIRQALLAKLVVSAPKRCLEISLVLPDSLFAGDFVCVGRITIAELPVRLQPLRLPIHVGVRAPFQIESASGKYMTSPSISHDGMIFAPEVGKVFDAEGSHLATLPLVRLGLGKSANWSAYADSTTSPGLVLLADDVKSSRVVAIDPVAYALHWATAPGALRRCGGIAALPTQGVAVVMSCGDTAYQDKLFTHRLWDGVRVGSVSAPGLDVFLAADSVTGLVFAGGDKSTSFQVLSWSWAAGSSCGVSATGRVEAAGTANASRPLVVMPPAAGSRTSHLIVGIADGDSLRVISLPGLTLVHTHTLKRTIVGGLAADPWGTALAVCDGASKAIHVLAWPLAGMPRLD